MPCCAASGCSTRPGQGKMLHRFPRDPDRRREWVIKVQRANWAPKDHTFLCEDHFDERQYESYRIDNRRQLKPYAIPTRFACKKKNKKNEKPRKPPRRQLAEHSYASAAAEDESSAAAAGAVCQSPTPPAPKPSPVPPHQKGESYGSSSSNQEEKDPASVGEMRPVCEEAMQVEEDKAATSALAAKAAVCTKTTFELLQQIQQLQKKLAKEKFEKRKLLKQMKTQEMNISKVFTADQLAKLSHKNLRGSQWSDETIKKALQLRQACGAAGYEMLLSQNQPLPSIRSLQRNAKLSKKKNFTDISNSKHIVNSSGIGHNSNGEPPEQKESPLDH